MTRRAIEWIRRNAWLLLAFAAAAFGLAVARRLLRARALPRQAREDLAQAERTLDMLTEDREALTKSLAASDAEVATIDERIEKLRAVIVDIHDGPVEPARTPEEVARAWEALGY